MSKKSKTIEVGDLVCFDGDEEGLILGVGLVMDTKGDIEDLFDLDSAVRDFYDEEEFWRLAHVLPSSPMILVLWSRSPSQAQSDFVLYKSEKVGYSFMWVYPTEVKVISQAKGKKKSGK
jgi:hypothetical protein